MSERLLLLRSLPQLAGRRRDAVSPETLAQVAPIVDAVRTGGEAALREFAQRFGDVQPGAQLFHRSEEHTSELQSQSNLVCRLLLEKKKPEPLHSTMSADWLRSTPTPPTG